MSLTGWLHRYIFRGTDQVLLCAAVLLVSVGCNAAAERRAKREYQRRNQAEEARHPDISSQMRNFRLPEKRAAPPPVIQKEKAR